MLVHVREIHADSQDIDDQGPCTDSQIMPNIECKTCDLTDLNR
jgi:hypothetical protein